MQGGMDLEIPLNTAKLDQLALGMGISFDELANADMGPR